MHIDVKLGPRLGGATYCFMMGMDPPPSFNRLDWVFSFARSELCGFTVVRFLGMQVLVTKDPMFPGDIVHRLFAFHFAFGWGVRFARMVEP